MNVRASVLAILAVSLFAGGCLDAEVPRLPTPPEEERNDTTKGGKTSLRDAAPAAELRLG